MRALVEIVRGQLKASGRTQETLAQAVGISDGFLSEILNGRKAPPQDLLTNWSTWTNALGLAGAAAEEFADALHVAAAMYYAPRVEQVIARMQEKVAEALKWREECDRRIERARQALDLIDPPKPTRVEAPAAPPDGPAR